MWFKSESPSYAENMNAAGNMTMEYGFDREYGVEYHSSYPTRGNHALVLQKGRNLHCLFWRLHFLFYFNPSIFSV